MVSAVSGLAVRRYDGDLSGEWDVTIGGSPYRIATRYSRTSEAVAKATQYAYEHFQAPGPTLTWDFGDGAAGSGQVATHTSASAGIYPVALAAANCAGGLHETQQVPVAGEPAHLLYLPYLHGGDSG